MTNIISSFVADTGTVNTLTAANTANAAMTRDASGQVAATTFTGNLTGNASGSSASFTGALAGDVTGTQGATVVSNAALTALAAGGATSGQYLAFNGTNWAPTTLTALTGTGAATQVGYFSGTNTLTSNSNFLLVNGGAGSHRLSVGRTTDNTSGTAGSVLTNFVIISPTGGTQTDTVSLIVSGTHSAAYSIALPPSGPTAAGQSLITSTTGSTANLAWGSATPAGTAGSVAFFDPSTGLLTSDGVLLYDGAGNFSSTNVAATGNLTASGALHLAAGVQATGANYAVTSTDTNIESYTAVPQNVNLPPLTSTPGGRFIAVANGGTATVSVVPDGSDIFANSGNSTPIALPPGAAVTLISNSNQTAWDIVAGYGLGAAPSVAPTIVPATGTVTVTEAQSKDYFQSAAGATTVYDLPVLATGNVVYDIMNDDATSTTQLSIPSGMTLRVPGAAAIAGPTTYSTSNAFAALKVIGNLSLLTYTVLEQTAAWTNP
jgi:hypothetical protein